MNKPYPSDLTDAQWALLLPLIPPDRSGGRPRKVDIRRVVNAIFYVNRTGCQWRQLPHDFPNWRNRSRPGGFTLTCLGDLGHPRA